MTDCFDDSVKRTQVKGPNGGKADWLEGDKGVACLLRQARPAYHSCMRLQGWAFRVLTSAQRDCVRTKKLYTRLSTSGSPVFGNTTLG